MKCNLALVVGAARSGTTLTRLLLDAHPEIGCPSEAGIPGLMAHQATVWTMVNADEVAAVETPGDPGVDGREESPPARWAGPANRDGNDQTTSRAVRRLPPDAREWICESVHVPMGEYCRRHGKRLYCDKSLTSVDHLALVHELFPETRMLLVFRHVMDTIASGIEASPWGFSAYGYAPYVQSSPGNAVAALASYWLDHVSKALEWEKEHPEMCHRLRYEDLVLQPETRMTEVQRFLGVNEDLSVLSKAFARPAPRGPGDYKVEHTSGVHAASIGHGKRVPVGMLPALLLKAVNEKLEALGYPPLDGSWNTGERLVDGGGQGLWAAKLVDLMDAISLQAGCSEVGPFAVVTEDHRALRWVIDPASGIVERGDSDNVEGVLTGTAEDLALMVTGDENLGVLLRAGRVRYVFVDEDETVRHDLMGELNELVGLLRSRLADPRGDELLA